MIELTEDIESANPAIAEFSGRIIDMVNAELDEEEAKPWPRPAQRITVHMLAVASVLRTMARQLEESQPEHAKAVRAMFESSCDLPWPPRKDEKSDG